jgi:hypothetical protein
MDDQAQRSAEARCARRPYTRPVIDDLGSLTELTAGPTGAADPSDAPAAYSAVAPAPS